MRDAIKTYSFRTTLGKRIIRAGGSGESIRLIVFYLTLGESVLWRSEIVKGDALYDRRQGELIPTHQEQPLFIHRGASDANHDKPAE